MVNILFIWLIFVHVVHFADWILDILVNLSSFWLTEFILVHFGSFWFILVHFGSFWFILADWVLTILVDFD